MINFSHMQNELKGFGGVIVSGCRCVYVRVCVYVVCCLCLDLYTDICSYLNAYYISYLEFSRYNNIIALYLYSSVSSAHAECV